MNQKTRDTIWGLIRKYNMDYISIINLILDNINPTDAKEIIKEIKKKYKPKPKPKYKEFKV